MVDFVIVFGYCYWSGALFLVICNWLQLIMQLYKIFNFFKIAFVVAYMIASITYVTFIFLQIFLKYSIFAIYLKK